MYELFFCFLHLRPEGVYVLAVPHDIIFLSNSSMVEFHHFKV